MQAIDELFNANQVNLQLLAVTPALLSIFALQIIFRIFITALRSTSRGRVVESASVIHRDLRSGCRKLERLITFSNSLSLKGEAMPSSPLPLPGDSFNMHLVEVGETMSILHRLQTILVVHSAIFDESTLKQLQEDLRDLSEPNVAARQQLITLDRIHRSYPFMQATRTIWASSLLQ